MGVMMQLQLVERPPATSIRKRRNLMVFGSKEVAYAWAEGHVPRKVPGAIGFNPPSAVRDIEAGGYILRYGVQMGGWVRYMVLGKSGHLLAR